MVIRKLFVKISCVKVSVSLSGFGHSAAHGKISLRRRFAQAKKNKGQNCSLRSLTPLHAVRAAAQWTGYKNRSLGKFRGVFIHSNSRLD